ncbi:Urease accessory protein UreG [Fundidesulfovibrio magnetotacticus]|uniref:Urease accessory protein UreG n=1 Tax=Fundidesulfovibrio magnetotacticus TaxID=2730080 RepID=A0A6V8M2P2_9BACT|nr:GTP-binding protein [Fundidesulfovibrio magnetotacticus]GFK94705.1 Urease accessory protein UreG [Fundidesulfovibrio magnetotacticus]
MKLVTVAGPPSCGKTSVVARACRALGGEGERCAVVKFDCLQSRDAELYEEAGVRAVVAFSGGLCPDHFYASNLEEAFAWAQGTGAGCLVIETAGLCNRCSPHIRGALALCVIDNLMGIDAPEKIGPMLRMADLVIVTKGDLVSQAEREVYRYRIRQMNKRAVIRHVNGLTGQGCAELARVMAMAPDVASVTEMRLRFSMPAAVCSYCLSETRIGERYQKGNVKKARFGGPHGD